MTEKEFNHIILPLGSNIWSFACNLTNDAAMAEDVTQEVMLKLWDNRKEVSKINNVKAYALKITRNLCLDFIKKQKPVYDEETMIKNGGYEPDLLQQIEDQYTAAAVKKVIDSLPPNQREVMILREIEEMEYEEISQITGLGLNNIRVLLSRGRNKVKEILVEKYRISKFEP